MAKLKKFRKAMQELREMAVRKGVILTNLYTIRLHKIVR